MFRDRDLVAFELMKDASVGRGKLARKYLMPIAEVNQVAALVIWGRWEWGVS